MDVFSAYFNARNAARTANLANNLAEWRAHAERIKGDLKTAIDTVGGLHNSSAASAGMRAVIRDILKTLRTAAPGHQFLDKAFRDRLFGEAFSEGLEHVSHLNGSWQSVEAELLAFGVLATEGFIALDQTTPGGFESAREALYKLFLDTKAAEYDKAVKADVLLRNDGAAMPPPFRAAREAFERRRDGKQYKHKG